MIFVYLPLAVLLIYFSVRSLQGGIDYLNFFRRELAKPPSAFTPFASVIAPCKGVDDGLAGNLRAVLEQDYPEYEVIFVVDNENDPAAQVIEEVAHTSTRVAKLVVATRSIDSSQKVENLREAVLNLDDRSQILVLVDSDVRPAKDWLRALVAPLEDEEAGAATGYRWFVTERSSVATELRSAWNASIASALGADTRSNFCWGGSTALRRSIFERLNIRERWRGTLSDDFTLTRALNEAGLPIRFVPQAIVPSSGSCSMLELLEFTNRQMKITRVYAQKFWLMSFFGSGLFTMVMIASAAIVAVGPMASFLWIAAMGTLVAVSALSIAKAWLRFRAIRLVLSDPALEKQFIYQMVLWLITPGIFLANSFAALFSRRITWRGSLYKMVSPRETRVMHGKPDAEKW